MTLLAQTKIAHTLGLCLVFVSITVSAGSTSQDYSPLTVYGSAYPNACTTQEKEELRSKLMSSTVPDPKAAWSTIELILCAKKDKPTQDKMRKLVQKRILTSVESTGQNTSKDVESRSEEFLSELMAEGQAWDARIDLRKEEVVLQYYANEACVNSATLRYVKRNWLVTKVGQACD
jgi:hypothetical protein